MLHQPLSISSYRNPNSERGAEGGGEKGGKEGKRPSEVNKSCFVADETGTLCFAQPEELDLALGSSEPNASKLSY